jgi:hypothetical protein
MKKQYTIRGIDKELDKAVRETATKYQVSVNKAAVRLLKKAVGLDTEDRPKVPPYHDMDDLAGALGKADADRMLKALKDARKIEPEMWKGS